MYNWLYRQGALTGSVQSGLTPRGRVESAAKTDGESVLSSTKAFILLIVANCRVVGTVGLSSKDSLELEFERCHSGEDPGRFMILGTSRLRIRLNIHSPFLCALVALLPKSFELHHSL